MRFSQLPLLWRVFAINATLLVIATLVILLARERIHTSLAFVEGVDVAVGLVLMLAANLFLLRQTLRPVDRLVERMRTVDLLRPGQRLVEEGGPEVGHLVSVFNQMLDRLESERRESGARALAGAGVGAGEDRAWIARRGRPGAHRRLAPARERRP